MLAIYILYIYIYICYIYNIYIYTYIYTHTHTYIYILCYCSELVVTLYTFVFTHITSVVKPVHIFMARSRVSKSPLKAELFYYRYVHFSSVPIYIFGFRHKWCASDQKEFAHVRFTNQLFSSADESLKDETHLLLL